MFLLLADIAKWVFNFTCSGVAAYYFTYVAFDPALLATYIFVSNIACVVGAYLSAPISRLLKSARNAMIAAFAFMAVMMLIAYFNLFNPMMVIVFMSLSLLGYGITYSCSTAMYADTVVYNEWKNRTNAAGWINGLQLFPLKIGFMARGILIPFVLAAVGFTTAADMAPFTVAGATLTAEYVAFQQGLGIAFMLIPTALVVLAAILLLVGYHLTPAKLKEYQAEIDTRKAAANTEK